MKNKNILISGAGIAGPALAFWLHVYGFKPTVIEMYPKIREGGYIIDFWGKGYDVAEKMHILSKLKEISYSIEKLVFLGDRGEKKGQINVEMAKKVIDGRMFSFLRSDLSNILYEITKPYTEYIFDDTITHLKQTEDGVFVTFKKNKEQKFDLVIGADGLHSNVRSLCFGKENQFEHFFGYYVSSCTIDNFLGKDFISKYTLYSIPDKQVAVYSLRENKLSVFFIFKHEKMIDTKDHDFQKKILKEVFENEKWICSEFIQRLDASYDFYFDSVSQIVMDTWSKDRIALLGDACFCPSLLSGQGAALSMTGAYVLAGELFQAKGDYIAAFKNYEKIFKPFVQKKQQTAKTFVRSFVPSSKLKIWMRNQASKWMNIPFFSKLYWKRFLVDELSLKDYK